MGRGKALNAGTWLAGWLLAALFAYTPLPVLAQNAAEGAAKPPPADPGSAAAAVDNSTPAAKDKDAAPANAAEGAAKPKPGEKAVVKPPAKDVPTPGAAPAPAPDKQGKSAPANAAEGSATAGDEIGLLPPAATPTPSTSAGAAPSQTRAPNPGGRAGPATAPTPRQDNPSTLPLPDANAAEGRVQSGAAANSADNANTPAEPPIPEYQLPAPNEAAGPSAGYQAPEIHLDVPGIDKLTPPEPIDTFQQPTRDYLKTRPLPPPDQTETDEERAARDIEQSLKDLSLPRDNQHGNEPIKLPLPSGQVAFKAADSFTYDRKNRVLTFTGNSELWFDKMLVAADYIQVDDGAATAYAKGYVMVQQADEVVYADEMYLNYDTGHLELFNVEGNTGGSRLAGGLEVDKGKITSGVVYFTAQHLTGSWDHMIMERCTVTTCDPFCGQSREVHLSARKIVYKRDRSIVLRDVHAYVRSHKVAWTPLLAFPLAKTKQRYTQEQSEIQQDYGFDSNSGWFAKFAYTYYTHYVEKARANLLGVAKVELVENLGAGLGIRQDFYIPALGVTQITGFYQRDWPAAVADDIFGRNHLNGDKNFDFSLKQELNLSHTLKGQLSSTRTNRFIPSTQLNGVGTRTDGWSSNFNLAYNQKNTQASLTGSQSINTTGGQVTQGGTQTPRSETISNSGSFSFGQTLLQPKAGVGHNTLKFHLDDQYTSNKGSGATSGVPADQEGTFDTNLDYTYMDQASAAAVAPLSPKGPPGSATTAEAEAPKYKHSPLDGLHAVLDYKEQGIDYDKDRNTRDNNNQISKALPQLTIDLPRDLINDHAYFTQFKIDMGNLVTGRRRSPESSFRANIHAGGSSTIKFSRDTNLTSSTGLDQYWYDDGNSQYNINQTLNYRYLNHRGFEFNSMWLLNFHQGVRQPPVTSDRRVYSQTISYGTALTNYRSWRWTLQSGFDLALDRHNPLTSTFSWDPNKCFNFTHSTSYSFEQPSNGWTFSTFTASVKSPYVDDRGIYNWVFNTSMGVDTNYMERWAINDLKMTYFRRYERGWSAEVTGGYRPGGANSHPPDISEDFLRNVVKSVTIRKVNCCTTLEGSWSASTHLFNLKMYLNALPQYPGTLDDSRANRSFTDHSNYIYQPQFLFPTDSLRTDILTDMFGITGVNF